MSDKPQPTLAERWIATLKNHPLAASLVVFGVILAGGASLADSFTKLKAFFLPEPPKPPITVVVTAPTPVPSPAPPVEQRLNPATAKPEVVAAAPHLLNCLPDSPMFRLITEATLPKAMQSPPFRAGALLDMAERGNASCVKAWLAAGASANGEEPAANGSVRGQTPLVAALQAGQIETARLLLENGADAGLVALAYRGQLGVSPLLAASSQSESVALLILARGPDVNFAGDNGWTALHYAASRGYAVLAQELVARGASKSAQLSPFFGSKTPRALAVDKKHTAVASAL